jgi:hypothetical protein
MTDQKRQGKQFPDVLVKLNGRSRWKHRNKTEYDAPVRAVIEGGEVGGALRIPKTGTGQLQRAEERAR